jgi:hypothetical protein
MQLLLPSQSNIITCAEEVEMIRQLGAQLELLKMTVKLKTAVPPSQVFVFVINFDVLFQIP